MAALTGFAANSILCRMALQPRLADAASFTTIRLLSGALVLFVLCRAISDPARAPGSAGSWPSAAALFAYAAAFSFAYVRVGAGVGALLLFGAVQATMLAWALRRGERPGALEWIGLAVALGGLVALVLPGLGAPDPTGAALMFAAGVAWGVYSLRGRGTSDPLAATASNFARAVPFTLASSLLAAGHVRVTGEGALLAVASGALASGVGYSLWYAALRGLTATRAAIVQLSVPVLAATGGVLLLGERLSPRLVLAGAAILGGVALAMGGSTHGRRS
ncbi:MAG TPA: DMT family transporter [Vicinamibacteria bacterium]|nr:DMT family transporter [Vicinamibacteria bacterium]